MSKKEKREASETPSHDEMVDIRTRQQEQAELERINLLRAYQRVMDDEHGIMVLRHILGFTNYRCTPWDKHAGVMAHNVGKMEVGNFITAHMAEADTDLYCKLMVYDEQANKRQD